MGEETEATGSGSDERLLSIERKLVKNRQNVLLIKVGKAHQRADDANDDRLVENRIYEPANKFFSSKNNSLDHGAIREDSLSCYRKTNSYLNHEINHQLKNPNVDFAGSVIGEEENTYNVPVEYVKKDDVPQIIRNEYTCSVCGKDFKSMKSLSGHMRCHPERDWRGIQPPSNVKNSASSTISESGEQKMDDQNDSATTMDILAFGQLPPLSNWSVKRNRNTAVRNLKLSNLFEDLQDVELEAIENLLMLAHGDPMELAPKKNKQSGKESETKIRDFESEKSRFWEGDCTSGNAFRSEPMKIDSRSRIIQRSGKMNYNKHRKQFPYRTEIRKKLLKKRKFQHVKAVHGKWKFAASARHICRTCNKSFPSHQALGGHRASHKKGVLMTATEVDEFSKGDDGEDNRYENLDRAHSKPLPETDVACLKEETVHRCKTCNKTFPSGQALGGHQRCHWGGMVESSMTSVKFQEDERKTVRQHHDFDLNELPMFEDSNDLEFPSSAHLASS